MPSIPREVNLPACLFGGQAFTWWPEGDAIEGVAKGTHVRIDPGNARYATAPARPDDLLHTYLGSSRAAPSMLAGDANLGPLVEALPGLRLLDQDPWEGFVSFMLSPVNNVPRIQENIARLCRALGEPVGPVHAMPSAERIAEAGAERLRELRLGFRGPRLHAAAEAVVAGELDLEALARGEITEARAVLLELDGVGPKVAECILCYALGFDEAFPVDRWVQRAGEALFGACPSPDEAVERWGDRAAIAQQLLFHGARTGLVEGVPASPVARFAGWRRL